MNYEMREPFFITGGLNPGLRIETGGWIEISPDNRVSIYINGSRAFSTKDFRAPFQTMQERFVTILDFLESAGDTMLSRKRGQQPMPGVPDPFPAQVMAWAALKREHLQDLRLMLEETEDLIVEVQ